MAKAKPVYIVTNRIRLADPKLDREEPLGITEDPVDALKMVKRAKADGRIEMREPDGTVRHFTGRNYNAVDRRQPGHRTDSRGSDRYHGFIEYCETSGAGSPVARAKPRTSGKRKRATTKARQRK